jgi:uncharacterized protein YndB with AHSA1/START domain/uncharacterized protein YciI
VPARSTSRHPHQAKAKTAPHDLPEGRVDAHRSFWQTSLNDPKKDRGGFAMSEVLDKRKGAARAIADLSTGTILATVDIAAPIERVFQAITRADDVLKWWGSPETYRTTAWTSDLRVGGAWRAGGVGADGVSFSVGGEYLEVNPPHRLVQTWKAGWDGGHVTTLTYVLTESAGGTRMTLRHDGFAGRPESCASHGQGWELVLGWLRAHLAGPPAPAQYFCSRLLPPRPSFPGDMTPTELKVMQAHVAYWTALLHEGKAVVFGPVADPKGAWGLGVLRGKDRAEVEASLSRDPVILANLGFSHELLPMPQAVH